MSLLEGSGFKCIKDGFETRDVRKWNEHCSRKEGDTTHVTESGRRNCISCKEMVEFEDVPYTPFDELGRKPIVILCDDCAEKQGAIKSVKKVSKTGGGKK